METEQRAANIQKYSKIAGTAVVAGAASLAVIAVGASLVTASVIAVVALIMVNFVVPVTARSVALWRVRALTQLTETFSEETIREDEVKEAERIRQLEGQYKSSRAELEGAQEEIEQQMASATVEEREMLRVQLATLQKVITEAESTLQQRKVDFQELQRVNKLYIAIHRSASIMAKASGTERNPEEIQRIETARTSIKNKMREAMAGKTIDSMNVAIKKGPTLVASNVVGTRRIGP